MPFLHWEMGKRRARMAAVIKECTKTARQKKLKSTKPLRFETEPLEGPETFRIRRATSKFPGLKASTSKQDYGPWGKYMLQVAKGMSIYILFCYYIFVVGSKLRWKIYCFYLSLLINAQIYPLYKVPVLILIIVADMSEYPFHLLVGATGVTR